MKRFKKVIVFVVLVTLFVLPFSDVFSVSFQKPALPDYVILTTKDLLKGAGLFKQYRERNFNVTIVTLSEIGSDKAKDIRNYLRKHFQSGYLLIIGSEKTIPRPSMYPSEKQHNNSYNGPSKTETDLYYGLLRYNIDRDSDGFPGELWDDHIKIAPDLIVGRIPFDNESEIEKVFENTVNFEKKPPNKAVLAASFISYPGEVYQGAQIFNGDGAREEELIKSLLPVSAVTLYNKNGDFPSVYNADLHLTRKNFYSEISDAGFTDWVAHGSRSGAYNEIWVDKNHNGIPDDGYHFESFVSAGDNLKASGIFFSGSCLNENGSDNLGSALLKKGAVSFIGSTEISFSPSYFANRDDGGTGSINYYFTKNLVSGETVGKALYSSFEYFFNNLLFDDLEDPVEGSLMDIYDYNIYGDPALQWNYAFAKKNDKKTETRKTDVSIEAKGGKDIEITLNIPEKENLFFLFPAKNLLITNMSENSAVVDNNFGIIRLNGVSGSVLIKSKVRGELNGRVSVIDSKENESYKQLNVQGYDMRDFDFNGSVDENDFKILANSFGKTYMDLTFNKRCDLNFDHVINGKDLSLFLK